MKNHRGGLYPANISRNAKKARFVGIYLGADEHRHRRLLRACRERPRYGRAAEQRDEVAALHSITSSASESILSEIVMPSAFAVLRLMTSSNLVGCSTGKSEGLAPLRILSTYVAARRKRSGKCGP